MLCKKISCQPLPSSILDFVKQYLRISTGDDDVFLTQLINSTLDVILDKTCFSVQDCEFLCEFDIDLINTSRIINGSLKIPIITPSTEVLEIKINGEVVELDFNICDGFFYVKVCDLYNCCNRFCLEIRLNAGGVIVPDDILLLIAMEVEKIYDCDCSCNQDKIDMIYNKYNNKRFF